jgi:ABC-2 type transport system ATP-binding protein
MAKNRWLALPRMNFSSPYVDLPLRLTVLENLRIYARLYGVVDSKGRIAELAQDLELTQLMNRNTGSLSAGQRTRVALAKALINRPELLLLDEPTASLDPDTADWVRGYLANYQKERGATILLASHNMGEVERLAGDVLMLRKGKLVDRGSPADLVTRYGREDLELVFLDIARGGGVSTVAEEAA